MSQDAEEWRDIPSQPELQASSWGRIRVKPHEKAMPHGGTRIYGGTPTYGQWDGQRYLYARRGHKTLKVHRLVCEAFNGAPAEGQVCMHDDEDAGNNAPGNLVWGTQRENLNYPGFKAYCSSRTGDASPLRKGRARQVEMSERFVGSSSFFV